MNQTRPATVLMGECATASDSLPDSRNRRGMRASLLLMTDAMIRTQKLTRRFGQRTALDQLELAVEAGSVFAFLGPNGAGKTTTIRLLLGLLRPTSGAAYLFGESIIRARLRILKRVGALVEAPAAYPHLTGAENLRHACLLKDVARSDIARVLDIVRLAADAGRLVKTYSLGMKQRLGLAQALLGASELVLLDEPTNGLDPAGIQEMRLLLRELPAAHGVTVFLSSHLLAEVDQVATHVGIIRQGRLQFQGSLAELRAQRQSTLRIGLRRAAEAAGLLRRQGFEVALEQPDHLTLGAPDAALAARLNHLLVERGYDVFSLEIVQPTLEQMFLDLTQEVPA